MGKPSFKIIGFTSPQPFSDVRQEATEIREFLESGAVDWFHIRKINVSDAYVADLLSLIPVTLHPRLVLHSNFSISSRFNLRGVHFKSESARLAVKFISRSCHSLDELRQVSPPGLEYSFLSPVYDSISKPGYTKNFIVGSQELKTAVQDKAVVALGGVTPDKFKDLYQSKFAGAALLGYLWTPNLSLTNKIAEIKYNRNL